MKNRNIFITILLLALLFAAFIIRRWNEPLPKEAFDRRPGKISYTKHAQCRMACRQIDTGEIREILQKGSINFNKTALRDRPCPTYALQGRTAGGENLRVIFAQCDTETKVVTCYNLEQNFNCDCPDDDGKKTGAPRQKK